MEREHKTARDLERMIEEPLDLTPGSVRVVGWKRGWHAAPVAGWSSVSDDMRAKIDAASTALRAKYDLKR
jgi:hypothetical protein